MILALLQFTMLTLAVYIGLLCYAHKTRRRRTYLIWFDLASVLIAALSIIVFLSGKEQSRALELLAFKEQGIRLDALSILLKMPDYTGESCALKPLGAFAYVPNPERGSEPIKQFPDEICDWIADVTIALRQESVRTRSVFNPPAMMKNVCNDERCEPEMCLFLDMLTAYRGALLEHTNLESMAYFKGFYAEEL